MSSGKILVITLVICNLVILLKSAPVTDAPVSPSPPLIKSGGSVTPLTRGNDGDDVTGTTPSPSLATPPQTDAGNQSQDGGKIVLSLRRVSHNMMVVYVHGGSAARQTFGQALNFCRNLTQEMTAAKLAIPATETNEPWRTDLLSVHGPSMIQEEIMPWIKKVSRLNESPLNRLESLWIGGQAIKLKEAITGRPFLDQRWTDRSPVNFQNFHPQLIAVDTAKIGTKLCVSVDYTDGKWGAHHCNYQMFFVCQMRQSGLLYIHEPKPVSDQAGVKTTIVKPGKLIEVPVIVNKQV